MSRLFSWARTTLGPIFLIALCPPLVFLLWYTNTVLMGSLKALFLLVSQQGLFTALWKIWGPHVWGSMTAWKILAVFALMQLIFMRLLPGKKFKGLVTPKGNIPEYKSGGVLAFLLTIALFCVGSFYLHLFPASILYDNLGDLLGALNIFSLGFCLFLYFKGSFAPSSSDSGTTGNFIFDYYWGVELYPRIAGWDIKRFTNCRMGMMGWGLLVLSYAAKQHEVYGLSDSMTVSVALQLLYIFKFFLWEPGYLRSLDIMHDRAGFYICWGCLVWVPSVYTSPAMYLVHHPHHLGIGLSLLIFTLGASAILVNYLADCQKQRVRATKGNCTVWGKAPKLTHAAYVTADGEAKSSLLLSSGWWGIARHFHYLPEILAAFFWTVPALFLHGLPYFYVAFLTLLLVDRTFRDDKRCSHKYGKDWERYCHEVPYKLIPGIF